MYAPGAATMVVMQGAFAGRQSIVMAAQGGQTKQLLHNALPFFAMRANAPAIQLPGQQVGHFVGNRLLQKMCAVLLVQQAVEGQPVALWPSFARRLAAQLQADVRHGKGTLVVALSLLQAGAHSLKDSYRHGTQSKPVSG